MNGVTYELMIVGAGAAGLMAAIQAGRAGLSVLLVDGKDKIGAKILMSGGTRCNVTNQKIDISDYETALPRVLRNILSGFSSRETVEFFRSLGVELVLEEGGKYFPKTNSARTVLDALMKEVQRLRLDFRPGIKISEAKRNDALGFVLEAGTQRFNGRHLLLATGGLSYPTTGSDGSGYGLAQKFGHSLVKTWPALSPLLTDDLDWRSLSGVALPVRLSIEGHSAVQFKEALLFTHFGFSGPAALNISRYWQSLNHPSIVAHFLPQYHEDQIRQMWRKAAAENPKKSISTLLSAYFPNRVVSLFLKKSGIAESLVLNQWSKALQESLLQTVCCTVLPVTGVFGYKKAEVTAGGVSLEELDPRTLESKQCPGLFFAGEILDVDGRIGGFNFQWAWSSAVAAVRGICKKNGVKDL